MAEQTADMPLSGQGDRFGGSYKVSSSAETVIATLGVPVKAAGTMVAQGDSLGVTVATTNRITWTRREPRMVFVSFRGKLDVAAAADALMAHIYKNGAALATALNSQAVSVTAGSPLEVTISGYVEMDANDYIEVWVENEDTNANVTLTEGFVTVGG